MNSQALAFSDGAWRVISVGGIAYYVEDEYYGKFFKSHEKKPGQIGCVRWINGQLHYLHSLDDVCGDWWAYWKPCGPEVKP